MQHASQVRVTVENRVSQLCSRIFSFRELEASDGGANKLELMMSLQNVRGIPDRRVFSGGGGSVFNDNRGRG